MTRSERLRAQAFKNVQERKSKTNPKLTPAMNAGLRAKIAQRAERDPEFAKRVDEKIAQAQKKNPK